MMYNDGESARERMRLHGDKNKQKLGKRESMFDGNLDSFLLAAKGGNDSRR